MNIFNIKEILQNKLNQVFLTFHAFIFYFLLQKNTENTHRIIESSKSVPSVYTYV